MARIRTVKPAFFRHERLQELETTHANLRPMLVFQGLWTQADREGRFVWSPRQLKLDILPFVEFEMAYTLELLQSSGFIKRYEVGGRSYGYIPTWREHQKPHHQEAPSRIPSPPDVNPKRVGDSLRQIEQSQTTIQGASANVLSVKEIREAPKVVGESLSGFDREGGIGRENRKGKGPKSPADARDVEPTPEDLPALALARGLIEYLNIPFNNSLQTQVADCITAKARAAGMSLAEAHDYIRGKALKADPRPEKWLFWFRDARYDHELMKKSSPPAWDGRLKPVKLPQEAGGAAVQSGGVSENY